MCVCMGVGVCVCAWWKGGRLSLGNRGVKCTVYIRLFILVNWQRCSTQNRIAETLKHRGSG